MFLEDRAAVRKIEFGLIHPELSFLVQDENSLHDLGSGGLVSAGIHIDQSADRSRNTGSEFKTAQALQSEQFG